MQTELSSDILKYNVDRYKAVTLDADSSPLDANTFDKLLENTLARLRGVIRKLSHAKNL
jgi:hypothetical protein